MTVPAHPVKIRPFVIEDYPAVRTLWEDAELPYKPGGRDSESVVRREIDRDTASFFVAERNHRIIGVIFGTHDGRKGWINRLAVHPDEQHTGIAQRLLMTVESALEQKNIRIIACLIDEGNNASVAFFQKMGYIPHDDIHYYCKKHNEDV